MKEESRLGAADNPLLVAMLRSLGSSSSAVTRLKVDDQESLEIMLSVHDAKLAIWHRNEGGGTFSELRREVFGITAYEGGNVFQNIAGSSWARQWGIESVGIPISIGNYNLKQPNFANGSKQTSCPGAVNIIEAELRAWWDPSNSNGATRPFHGPWPYGIYPWGNWIENIVAGGCEPFVYLLGNTWGNGNCNTDLGGPPRNSTLWGIAQGLSFKLAQQEYPRLKYAHIGNEPNAGWFKEVPVDTGGVFARFFRDASLGIKTVVDAKIGGAVLCWGPLDGTPELSQWDWLTSLIDACTHIQRSPSNPKGSNALDFVDFHACACHDQRPSPLTLISPPALVFLVPLTQFLPLAADGNGEENGNRVLSEIHMVAAYSDARHALHMPSAITETSVALAGRANWTNRSFHFGHRTLPRLRQIMAVLAHPDKMLLVQEHDLSADAGGQFSFIGSSHNLSSMSNATPEMEMFRALKPLRGTRLDRDLLGLQDATMDAAAEVVWNGACFGIGRWYRQRLTPRSNRPVFPFC